jgi:thermitase
MSSYYVDQGKRIHLQPSRSFMAVRYQPGPSVPMAVAKMTRHEGFGDKRKTLQLPNDGLMLLPVEPDASRSTLHALLGASRVFNPESGAAGPSVFEESDGSMLIPDGNVNADLSGRSKQGIQELLQQVDARVEKEPTDTFPFHVLAPNDGDVFRLANTLAEARGIEAQPRFHKLLKVTRIAREARPPPSFASATGVDPLMPRQWGLHAIKADQAWSVTSGSAQVHVAVIDSGVDLEHPDLRANLLTGYDDVDEDEQPQPDLDAYNAHGTACAGIIAAVGRNGVGVIGVAPGCKVVPIRLAQVIDGFLHMKPEATSRCILEAVRRGAWVISNSYGGPRPDFTVRRAIIEAVSKGRGGKGCVVLASAGNDNGTVKYPAAYPEVIAVAATRRDDERCSPADWGLRQGSCFGPEVSVSAPGLDIWTTDTQANAGLTPAPLPVSGLGDYTGSFSGTSAACPFVAGVAALVLSVNEGLTALEVRHILESTADKTGGAGYESGGRNDYLGHGRVNAFAAVHEARRRLKPAGGFVKPT